MDLIINIDGASRGNPGPAAAGVVVREAKTLKVVHEAGYLLPRSTNNVAEYTGLLRALDVLEKIPRPGEGLVSICSDSQLMVRQITGEYRVKSADLQPLLQEARAKLRRVKNWKISHVPREQNARADVLANMALDAGRDVIVVGGDGSPATGAGAKASAASPATAKAPATGLRFAARLKASPGAKCPARCPAKTPFHFGPAAPEGFCIYAAQAVFDENPTLWREAKRTESQTQCAKCGVAIDVELM